ncbi:AAA family ATPase [Rudanella paleaurantiibacter]|uniref:AAA family ATPase n=1 Tax=Rudanella paleaurantiibacter TaxID=2614655 RepID=A0A7J5TRU6_9BACT|nr:ParA family protein [Rudanella paleaurantiibacter]KAB7725500.1 AAA family ATPase [Rudanella paleaurantiibacter]
MLTLESAKLFLKHNPALTVSVLEKESGLPKGTLSQGLLGSRNLNANHLTKLEPILNKYGYMEGLYTKARVIAVINHKGGVGKTTTTSSLGAALASRGFRVLLVDLDPQGNLSQILGVEQPKYQVAQALLTDAPLPVVRISENLSLAPSDLELADAEVQLILKVGGDLRLKNKLRPLLPDFDYVLIDCPPSLGKLTTSAMNAANSCLITLLPEISAVKGVDSLLSRYMEVKENLNSELVIDGIVFTMVKKNTVHDGIKENVRQTVPCKIFNTQIKHLIDYQKSQVMQMPINAFAGNSEASKNYDDFCEEYIAYLQIVK